MLGSGAFGGADWRCGCDHMTVSTEMGHTMTGTFEFAYEPAQTPDGGDRAAWNWTATNSGSTPVFQVVLTSTVTPESVRISAAAGDGDTKIAGNSSTARFAMVAPGARLAGSLEAPLPADLDSAVEINGRAVWQAQP
jgi:hypothetical protein